MVEPQSSKLITRVRFPSSPPSNAPFVGRLHLISSGWPTKGAVGGPCWRVERRGPVTVGPVTDQQAPPPASAIPTYGIAPPVGYATAEAATAPAAPRPPGPPRKWLGRGGGWILFAAFAALWVLSAYVFLMLIHFGDIPTLTIGAFPVAALLIYTMCYRLRPQDGITPQFLLLVFLVGGFTAWIASRTLEPILGAIMGAPNALPIQYQLIAPLLEELCKILVVVVIARWVAVRNARTGLFIGGAVGLGFAAFENIEKGQSALDFYGHVVSQTAFGYGAGIDGLAYNVVLRNVLTPVGHPVWTAVAAAALFAGSRNGRLRISALFVVAFISMAIVHTLWDFVPSVFNGIFPDPAINLPIAYGVYVILGVAGALTWNTIRRRSNRGLAAAAALIPPTPPEPLAATPTT